MDASSYGRHFGRGLLTAAIVVGLASSAITLGVVGIAYWASRPAADDVDHHPHEFGAAEAIGAPRSSCWDRTKNAHRRDNPDCAVCGSRTDINVHHVESFHEHPERECDPTNLITLCRPCHMAIGHRCEDGKYNWSCTNPRARADAAVISGWLKRRGLWPK